MAFALYGDRAKEIYDFFCEKILSRRDFFEYKLGDILNYMLREEKIANSFFKYNLIDFHSCSSVNVHYLLRCSPSYEKTWDSGVLDPYLYKLNGVQIRQIFNEFSNAEKICDSGKLDPYLNKLSGYQITLVLCESPIAYKIWDSTKLDAYLNKLDAYHIKLLLEESPIKDKIKQSGKLKLS